MRILCAANKSSYDVLMARADRSNLENVGTCTRSGQVLNRTRTLGEYEDVRQEIECRAPAHMCSNYFAAFASGFMSKKKMNDIDRIILFSFIDKRLKLNKIFLTSTIKSNLIN